MRIKDDSFAWQILAETEGEQLSFPKQISHKPIDDETITETILETLKKYDCLDLTADEIINLVFIAADEEQAIVEDLAPEFYWPIGRPENYNENYNKFRQTKEVTWRG